MIIEGPRQQERGGHQRHALLHPLQDGETDQGNAAAGRHHGRLTIVEQARAGSADVKPHHVRIYSNLLGRFSDVFS